MQRFKFPLDNVMQYRNMLAELQRSRLEGMLTELRLLDASSLELDASRDSANEDVKSQPSNFALSLVALDSFTRHIGGEKTRLQQARIALLAKIAEQQTAVMQSQREYDLLDHLRDRNMAQWKRAFTKELEETASESYLALMGRRDRQDSEAQPQS